MDKSIVINGKEYEIPTINFKAIVKLEQLGVNFQDIETQSMTFINGLVALTVGCSADKASDIIEQHVSNGGAFEDLLSLIEAVQSSDFFQNLSKKRKKK